MNFSKFISLIYEKLHLPTSHKPTKLKADPAYHKSRPSDIQEPRLLKTKNTKTNQFKPNGTKERDGQ